MSEAKIRQDKCTGQCNDMTDHEVKKDNTGENMTCIVCGSQHGYLTMGIGENFGNLFTEMVRNTAWMDCKRDKAILMLLKAMQGMDIGQAETIIDGKNKLVTKDRGGCSMVEDTEWSPPYERIKEMKDAIAKVFNYIGFPASTSNKKPLGGCWYDHLTSRDSAKLDDEARIISQLEETNIWQAGSRAKFLQDYAEHIMRENAKSRGDSFRATKLKRTVLTDAEQVKVNNGLLDEMKAMAISNIAQSDMPEDMKKRMIRVADGQIDAMQGKVQIVEDEKFVFDTGWLAPNGVYYGCKPGQHIDLSDQLAKANLGQEAGMNAEYSLEQAGWAKCSGTNWYFSSRTKLTKKQLDTLFDWSLKWGDPIQWNGSTMPFKEIMELKGGY